MCEKVKQRRFNKIMEIQKDISKQRLKRLVGTKVMVIVEGDEKPYMTGRLLTQAPDIDGIAFIKGGLRCRGNKGRENSENP